jgi:hypothetical protein
MILVFCRFFLKIKVKNWIKTKNIEVGRTIIYMDLKPINRQSNNKKADIDAEGINSFALF